MFINFQLVNMSTKKFFVLNSLVNRLFIIHVPPNCDFTGQCDTTINIVLVHGENEDYFFFC